MAVIHGDSVDIDRAIMSSGLVLSEGAIVAPVESHFTDSLSFTHATKEAFWVLAGVVWALNTPRAQARYSIQKKLF